MPATKRVSTGGDEDHRTCKAMKTNDGNKQKSKTQALSRSKFREEALPIHVNLTHTPAATIESEEELTKSSDPGHIGSITMLPANFSTGSYGWKGARKMTVELQGAEGEEKREVQIMININATVIGSKDAEDGDITDNTEDLA
ncbi:hypothetical protein BU17DRAFT_89191 [Hysterangium stoloniferum]|nr:hypothetical protein BU17DRAFT_89191 [Hysterangium stoloniferum]